MKKIGMDVQDHDYNLAEVSEWAKKILAGEQFPEEFNQKENFINAQIFIEDYEAKQKQEQEKERKAA